MTITTAKQPATSAVRLRPGLRLAPLAAAALLLAACPARADWRVTPTLLVSEIWTDNVDLVADEQAHSDLITQVAPGVMVTSRSRRMDLTASAQLSQYAYLRDSSQRNNTVDGRSAANTQMSYNGIMRSELAENLFYLDATASRGQRSISAFGPQTGNDSFRQSNRTNVTSWSISPYLAHRFGSTATALVRYTRDSVDSSEFTGFRQTGGDSLTASLSSGPAFRTIGWGLNYYKQELSGDRYGDSSTETLGANLRYIVSPRLSLTANGGYDRYEFEGLGGREQGANWSAGFIWNPSLRTNLQASAGRHYYGTTGSLLASHRTRRTTWTASYGDTITTSRQQFLLPATYDTASLLDSMFATAYPDPAERQRVVAAYIQQTGLPPALADSVNYLSNRFMRQKQLRASMAYRYGRSSALVSLHASRRNALSDQQSDSTLLGSQAGTLNERVRQYGVDATYTYRINSRANLIAGFDVDHSRSLETEREDYQRTARVALTRRWGEGLLGTVEVRRRTGDIGYLGVGRYNERSLWASLSMQF